MDSPARPPFWKRRANSFRLGVAGAAMLTGGWLGSSFQSGTLFYLNRNAVREEMWSVSSYDGLIIANRFVIPLSTRPTGFEFHTGPASGMVLWPDRFNFSRQMGPPPLNLQYTLQCPIWLLIPPWIGACLAVMAWRDCGEAHRLARRDAQIPGG